MMFQSLCTDTAVKPACEILSRPGGGVLLVPTETVYGLVCDSASAAGRSKIYEMKHRPASKLLTLFFASTASAAEALPSMPDTARIFAEKFCPGPITLIVPDGAVFTGFRIPDHPFLLQLLAAYGRPLASTSANLSGQPAAHTVEEALSSLAIPPDGVLDGGAIPPDSAASTVVKVKGSGEWEILRLGPISEEALRGALRN